jgi:hypothetical protein
MCWDKNRPPRGPTKRADICHKPPSCASLQGRSKRENRVDIEAKMPALARNARLSADLGSDIPANWPVGSSVGFVAFRVSHDRIAWAS